METTSDLRKALCAAITKHCQSATREHRAWLAEALDEHGYEDRTDAGLIALAEAAGVDTAKLDEIKTTKSAGRYEERVTYLCRYCRDLFWIRGSDDRWSRCDNCNSGQAPTERFEA